MPALLNIGAERVLYCDRQGPVIDSRQRALDLVGEALGLDATLVAIPVVRLGAPFFDLRSGVAGEIAQIGVNYGVKFAVLGDVSAHEAASDAFRDWVIECNRRGDLWFVADLDALKARLGA
jgi:hypothetical protein